MKIYQIKLSNFSNICISCSNQTVASNFEQIFLSGHKSLFWKGLEIKSSNFSNICISCRTKLLFHFFVTFGADCWRRCQSVDLGGAREKPHRATLLLFSTAAEMLLSNKFIFALGTQWIRKSRLTSKKYRKFPTERC